MYTIKNINDFEESLKKLLVIRFVSSITVVVLFLIPFYFYLVDGKIVIDSVFIMINILNVLFIVVSYKISEKIKFKKIQIEHFKYQGKNNDKK